MPANAEIFLAEWHRIVAERDLKGLRSVLAPDVALGAPPYWSKLKGVDLVHHLLGLIIETIDGFTYHREWESGPELALEFRGAVSGLDLQGIDLISLDANSQVRNLDVLMRPINAVSQLRDLIAPKMAEFLKERGRAQS